MPDDLTLPSDLARDLTDSNGNKVTLIIGAGCSVEAPTNLPLSRILSRQVHQRLLDDEILLEPCQDPEDLSHVADAVYEVKASQRPVVERMGMQRFIGVEPNAGHKIAAALMRERIVATVITLNYDDAMTQAVGHVGGKREIQEIRGPEAHADLGSINLVYLHRKADADPEELILRTETLENEWKQNWEEAIVHSQLVRSSTLFAGLGSPAKVLTESAKRIRGITGEGATFYQADPGDYESPDEQGTPQKSPFTEALAITEDRYIKLGWCTLMELVGTRVQLQHLQDISEACVNLAEEQEQGLFEEFDDEAADQLRGRIRALFDPGSEPYSFLEMGTLRARWFLESGQEYFPHRRDDVPVWIAQLMLAVDYIARRYQFEDVVFSLYDGCVQFREQDGRTLMGHLAHGRARESWDNLETVLPVSTAANRERTTRPTFVLAEGMRGQPVEPTPPRNIAEPDGENDETYVPDIMQTTSAITRVPVYHLHEKVDILRAVFE